MQTFFSDDDYREYIALMADSCRRYEVDVWAYCLMPNHVHFIALPSQPDSFRHSMGEAHRRTLHVNFREKWRGHFWQEHFASYPMGENHLLAAARYMDEMNPVCAGLAREPMKSMKIS